MAKQRKKKTPGHTENLYGEGIGPADRLKRIPQRRRFWEIRLETFQRDHDKIESQIADLRTKQETMKNEYDRAPQAIENINAEEASLHLEMKAVTAAPTVKKVVRDVSKLKALVAQLKEEDLATMSVEDQELIRTFVSSTAIPTA